MKVLFVLRGLPGSGKSSFIKENNLEAWTIEPDSIRMLVGGLSLNTQDEMVISQDYDTWVWRLVDEILEFRLDKGILTFLDATSIPLKTLNKYKKLCEIYNVRLYIVDFTNISLEECKKRNESRFTLQPYKKVPEEVLDRMYGQLLAVKQEDLKKFDIITPKEALSILSKGIVPEDVNSYDKVIVFGDIHGCYEPLNEYFTKNPMNDNTYYVFLGDYFDRGIQNKEVLQFCLDNCEKPNFCFIQGNHEIWLKNYMRAGKDANVTPEFRKLLEQFGELKSHLSKFGRRLRQCLTFEKNGYKFVFTHGGVTRPTSVEVPTIQLIKGVGKYSESEIVDETFINNLLNQNRYSFHGHRNIYNVPIRNTERTFNLEGKVEFGGYLRGVEIDFNGDKPMFKEIEIKNNVFNEKLIKKEIKYEHNNDILKSLDTSTLVRKKELSNGIVSYNFTRDAFYKKQWDEMTTTARGLFVDSESGKVIARSYNKFGNLIID